MTQRRAPSPDSGAPLSPAEVARIVGESGTAAYEWRLAQDRLTWSGNAPAVLGIPDIALAGSGADFAALIDPDGGRSRSDALADGGAAHAEEAAADPAAGMRFETVYGLRPFGEAQERIWVEDRGVWFAGPDGRPARVEGTVRRLTEDQARAKEMERLARVAPQVTQINRQHLAHLLGERLADAARFRSQFGFLLIGVDHLGQLNEAYGFEVADEVIEMIGQRLRARMRGPDEIGRFSGNKFGIVLKDCSPEDMAVAARRFISSIADNALQTSGGAVPVTVTAGGVTAPRHARTEAEIFTRAQDALEHAKASARGSFRAYQPSLEREATRRANLRLTDDIVAALSGNRVTLAFQPIAEAGSRRVVLHECLVRVSGEGGEQLGGAAIVPLAEKFGLMRLLDCRVLELALDVLAREPELRLAVNVSPSTVSDRTWLSLLEHRSRRKLAPRLVVELTETAAIRDMEAARRFVQRLRELGSTVAMDDFGAGYTSFRNLRQLGVDVLKLDGSFISALMDSEDDRFFVRTLLDLARHMGVKTVAEWVPDERTADQLAQWGCDYLQGELIGLAGPRPLRTS